MSEMEVLRKSDHPNKTLVFRDNDEVKLQIKDWYFDEWMSEPQDIVRTHTLTVAEAKELWEQLTELLTYWGDSNEN